MRKLRIRVLSDDLVNQIAAGEVIENPASVVKELVENAVDAGASRIIVEVEDGGASLVRVTDNGRGMTDEEAELALRRHATSKISSVNDLHSIRTLGFRGEALPSIASISKFTLETRAPDDDTGTRIVVVDGNIEAEPCACTIGTIVAVRDLFFNVPARLKFMKGKRSRMMAIRDLVMKTAMAFPSLHMTLRTRSRKLLDYPPCTRSVDRVAMVLGKGVSGHVHEFRSERDGISVDGVLGDPSLARPDPKRVALIVNDRPVKDLALRRAVLQAYSVLIPSGRYPVAVVRVDVDPSEVDVNVHPRKIEVRFKRHREVAGVVFGAVRETIADTPWIRPDTPIEQGVAGPQVSLADSTRPWEYTREGAGDSSTVSEPEILFKEEGQETEGARFSSLRYLGQIARTVLVCEGNGTFVLIDQHAAHERVNHDRLWRMLESDEVVSEPLMFPEIVSLSPQEVGRFEEIRDDLTRLGFDLERYSGDSIAVRAVPAVMKGRSVASTVRDCAAAASEESEADPTARIGKVVSTVACHASVRASDEMSEDEVRALLKAMDGVDLASYCPHGRQAVVVYPIGTVLRWFGR